MPLGDRSESADSASEKGHGYRALSRSVEASLVGTLGAWLASFLITNSVHGNLVSPSVGALVRSMLAGWLILCMWCLFGVTLAVLLRGTALSIGLGLVWVLAVENLIRATASLVPALGTFQKGLPGVNAGSLVAALGGKGAANSGTGIAPIVGGTQALLVVVFYFVLFGMVGALIVRRRDVQ